jgi:hypothetical protein
MARTEADLLGLALPKWPQHYVTGKPVTVEQAKEIIRRTDSFFCHGYGGNNHKYNSWVRKTLGMAPDMWDRPHRPYPKDDAPQAEKDADLAARRAEYAEDNRLRELFEKRWHPLQTEYVHNSWISCSFIGGPHGWCHPDGQIGYVDNVGKWPSVEAVFNDWKVLAEAFPFIDIGVTLFDGESCEDNTNKIVSMRVRGSEVVLIDPAAEDVHAGHPTAVRRGADTETMEAQVLALVHNPWREQGLPDAWIEEWASKFGPGVAT